jgi:hypothetical protein
MTFDNGREFCGHEKLSESLKVEVFFATPDHSWERGLNEHTNGLIREFYPKSTNFKIVKQEDFQKVVDFINHRVRKSRLSSPHTKYSLLHQSPLYFKFGSARLFIIYRESNKFRGGYITCTKQYFENLPIKLIAPFAQKNFAN